MADAVVDRLHAEFDFDGGNSLKAAAVDGDVVWGARTFLFPPMMHSRRWLRAAVHRFHRPDGPQAQTIVVLLPFRPASVHFAEWVFPYATEVRVLRQRLTLPGYERPAKFAYCVVVYQRHQAASDVAPSPKLLTDRVVTLRTPTLEDVYQACWTCLGKSFTTVLRAATDADAERTWPTPAFVSARKSVYRFFVRARDVAQASKEPVFLVVPCRAETKYFVVEIMAPEVPGAPDQVWFLHPNLIYDDYPTKYHSPSMVLVWHVQKLPCARIASRLYQF